MSIITFQTEFAGQASILPRRGAMVTTDNYNTIITAGYINNSPSSRGQPVTEGDFLFVTYNTNFAGLGGTPDLFTLNIDTAGTITLIPFSSEDGSITAIDGTENQIDINRVGSVATVSFDTEAIFPGTVQTTENLTVNSYALIANALGIGGIYPEYMLDLTTSEGGIQPSIRLAEQTSSLATPGNANDIVIFNQSGNVAGYLGLLDSNGNVVTFGSNTLNGSFGMGYAVFGSANQGSISNLVAIGNESLANTVGDVDIVAVGQASMKNYNANVGGEIIAVGTSSGGQCISGNDNIFLGAHCGNSGLSSIYNQAILIGSQADCGADNLTNVGCIGFQSRILVDNGFNLYGFLFGLNNPSPAYQIDCLSLGGNAAWRMDVQTGTPTAPSSGLVFYTDGTYLYSIDSSSNKIKYTGTPV
jgi:hypothetical protein